MIKRILLLHEGMAKKGPGLLGHMIWTLVMLYDLEQRGTGGSSNVFVNCCKGLDGGHVTESLKLCITQYKVKVHHER